jgi:hypothetical protein
MLLLEALEGDAHDLAQLLGGSVRVEHHHEHLPIPHCSKFDGREIY